MLVCLRLLFLDCVALVVVLALLDTVLTPELPLVFFRCRLVVGESTRSFVVELEASLIGSGLRSTGEFIVAKKSPTLSKLNDGE